MRRRELIGLATLVALGCVLGASLSYAADKRLLHAVTAEQTGTSLGSYVSEMAERSGLHHHVRRPFDARPIVALNIKLPLDKLQAGIAGTYELTWSATSVEPPEYTLYESPRDRKTRANALELAGRRARDRLMDRWREVRQLAFASPEQLRDLTKTDPGMAKVLASARSGAMKRLVFQLPPAALSRFFTSGSYSGPVAALPPALQDLAVTAWGRDKVNPPPTDVLRGSLLLQYGGTADRPTVWASFISGRNASHFNILYAEGWTRQPPGDRRGEKRPRATPPSDPRFATEVTLRDVKRSSTLDAGERPERAKPLAVLLSDLAKQVNIPLLAECDHRPKDPDWLATQWWLAEDIVDEPLARTLDLVCADFQYEWRFEGGALLLRPRLWYLDPSARAYRDPTTRPPQR